MHLLFYRLFSLTLLLCLLIWEVTCAATFLNNDDVDPERIVQFEKTRRQLTGEEPLPVPYDPLPTKRELREAQVQANIDSITGAAKKKTERKNALEKIKASMKKKASKYTE